MSDDADTDDHLVTIGNELLEALNSEEVTVKLKSGSSVRGALTGFNLRQKKKKSEAAWAGTLSIQTEPGVLEIDWATVESVEGD